MSDSAPHSSPHTVADLWALTDGASNYELSRGELLVSEPPPGWEHGAISANLVACLQLFASTHNLGRVVTCNTWFVLQRSPDTVRGPDVAFVRRERCQAVGDSSAAFEGPPDLAVEVLSPSDTTKRIQRKVRDYERAGVPAIWLVQPKDQTVTVIEHGQKQMLKAGDLLRCEEELPGFEIRVALIFQ